MKIGIIGSGAIGLYYGACLQRAGQEVRFLFRSDYDVASKKGIEVRTPEGGFRLPEVEAFASVAEMGELDLVVISLKTTSNPALPELLKPIVGPQTVLLTLQNGLGNDRLLAELYPENVVLGALCFICLNRVGPAAVENFLPGSIAIGPFRTKDYEIAAEVGGLFSGAGIETRVERDLALTQWKKLVWNVPFNGLSIAAGGVPTDVILASEPLLKETRSLMEEVLAGAAALGHEIRSSFVDLQIDRTRAMGAYKPSSMIDFVDGKKVEVESIWGEPLRQATAAGGRLPKLEMLYALLTRLCRT